MWNTGTAIYNYSGVSVPEFTIDSDGTLSIWEFVYKNVPSILPYLLWSKTTNATGDVVLHLSSNLGCLSLNGSDDGTGWELCGSWDYESELEGTSTSTSTPLTTDGNDTGSGGDAMTGDSASSD